ncbi:two-component regulator propeller domain-containing protein [Colwellia chukchiensis]|nr:two-component regulator propeller domain-containing protein [Colwellia chukchiensis]
MSYNFVRTMAQDQYGFMWFGSSEGLDRFDGHQVVSFHHDASKTNSLSSDVISRIVIDSREKLWVGTFGGGINLYRPASQDFMHFSSKSADLALSNDIVNAIFEDSQGQIWVGTEKGINLITQRAGQWQVKQIVQAAEHENGLTHNTIHAIAEVNGNEIWVGTHGGGISVFDHSGSFKRAIHLDNIDSESYQFISSLLVDKQNNVWIGTVDNGLFRVTLANADVQHYTFNANQECSLTSNAITSLYQDAEHAIWIATDNGLSIYNHQTHDFTRYRHAANNPYSLSNDFIITFFEDNNKMMWIGTFSGVNRWDPNMATFRQYSAQTQPQLKNFNITSFAQIDEQHIIFSAYSGWIYQLSLSDQTITATDFSEHFAEFRVMTLFADNNLLWVGTRSNGLFMVDLTTHAIRAFRHDEKNPATISANSITDIIKDQQGNIWVSTFHKGINKLNADGSFIRYPANENFPTQGPSSDHVLQLLVDDEGFIWLATFGGGLSRFEPSLEKFQHINHQATNPNSLSSDLSWTMAFDSDNNLWVGTQAGGLNILSVEDRKNGQFNFKHLNSKDGMKSMTVYGITQDDYGDIWLSTSKGISRYSPRDGRFKHFDLTHGLVDLEFTHSAIFKGLDHTLYFGSGKGFNSIMPGNVNQKPPAPSVRLTNIVKVNEAMSLPTELAKLTHLTLAYDHQLITFEYIGLNYASPESTHYQYRLLGFDQQWLDAGKSRRATYTNLPAGNYRLQIKAANSDSLWSEPSLELDITVNPAPWQTWWAYLLYTVLIAFTILIYSRFLNRKLILEQQQKLYLAQQVKEKTDKFKTQNLALAQANKQLEKAAIVDKVTGVKSRRYLDIYIEQTSQLMKQMHQNLLPVQRDLLPRLYILMVKVSDFAEFSDSQLINLTDLLLYTRNSDDLVIRWSDDTFAIIGYEKDNNASELATRLATRFAGLVTDLKTINMAYAYFPFSRDNPLGLNWDQISVLIEQALAFAEQDPQLAWLGLCGPKSTSFDYLALMQANSLSSVKAQLVVKSGLL